MVTETGALAQVVKKSCSFIAFRHWPLVYDIIPRLALALRSPVSMSSNCRDGLQASASVH